MRCRHCNTLLSYTFLDLGFAPPSNAYLTKKNLDGPEIYFPLKIKVCDVCWLVQTEDYASAEHLFDENYAYFSSTSASWLLHAKKYVDHVIPLFGLNEKSLVVEVASNDGYLLKNFVENNVPCLGIEPTKSTADAARSIGIPVISEFFGYTLAKNMVDESGKANLIIGNNVLAHVPDINDFTAGLACLLSEQGTITLEFPHLLNLIVENQFDTVYHEHFSYLSLHAVTNVLNEQNLRVWDVEKLPTHGGSLRLYICHQAASQSTKNSVENILAEEKSKKLLSVDTYKEFQIRANKAKNDFLMFLLSENKKGKRIAAYGAAAKGNTFLNYAGIKADLIEFVCDAAESKQHKYLPGSHIPILPPSALKAHQVDWVIVFPWNLINEIKQSHAYIADWGGKFVTAIPQLTIHE